MTEFKIVYFLVFSGKLRLVILQNSGSAACCSKVSNQRTSVSRKERCFNQERVKSGEEDVLISWDQLPKILLSHDSFKGKKRDNLWIMEAGVVSASFSIAWILTDSSDIILPMWSACGITKRVVRSIELVII